MSKSHYKYPLDDVREIRDLRDMIRQSEKLYGDLPAYLIKDPIALREVDPRSEEGRALKKDPKRPYKEITFKQFAKDVRDFATGLMALGVNAESRVAIYAETRYEWYVSYLAVVNGLAVVVPLDKEQPPKELASLMERSHADFLIYSKAKKEAVDEVRAGLTGVRHFIRMDLPEADSDDQFFWDLLDDGARRREAGDLSYDELELDPEAMSILLFTSGTTSRSKAVMLSHRNICANLMGMCSMIYIDEHDTFLSVLPLHHTYECTCGYLCQLYRGSKVAVCDGLRYIVQNLKEAKATMILVVPIMLEAFHRQIRRKATADPKTARKFNFGMKLAAFLMKFKIDVRKKLFKDVHEAFGGHMRLMIAGGAAMDAKVLENMQTMGFHCVQGYGLTECAPILALNRTYYYNNHSAGLPLPSVDVKILNPDENGIGEIAGRGPNVMMGYYENPEATAAAIDEDGFYHTGDLGYMTPEDFVIITGRKSNLIVTKNGKNVFPEEIEFLLNKYDLIQESVVFGQPQADGDLLVTAEVFPNAEAIARDPDLKGLALTDPKVKEKIQAIVKEVNAELVPYKHVRNLILRDKEFEKTTSRKIKRY